MGDWLFISGQGPLDPSGKIVGSCIRTQTEQTMQNIKRLIMAAGGSMEHVARCTCHLSTLSDFAEFDAIYRSHFSAPYPARTTVGSELDGILVEIDAMVWLGSDA
jgi:2-iminobutanoate/2-iminopropanoate deaminase